MIRLFLLGPRIVLAVVCVAVIVPAGLLLFMLGRGGEDRYP